MSGGEFIIGTFLIYWVAAGIMMIGEFKIPFTEIIVQVSAPTVRNVLIVHVILVAISFAIWGFEDGIFQLESALHYIVPLTVSFIAHTGAVLMLLGGGSKASPATTNSSQTSGKTRGTSLKATS
jgi:hypothetical protein